MKNVETVCQVSFNGERRLGVVDHQALNMYPEIKCPSNTTEAAKAHTDTHTKCVALGLLCVSSFLLCIHSGCARPLFQGVARRTKNSLTFSTLSTQPSLQSRTPQVRFCLTLTTCNPHLVREFSVLSRSRLLKSPRT